MQTKTLRLPLLSMALSLSFSFCARAETFFDTMSNARTSAYIVHNDEDDNAIEVEVTGDYVLKKLRAAGDTSEGGIPRDKLVIRIPELKINVAENPHAEYHDFYEIMEEATGLNGMHDGFFNTTIVRAGSSIGLETENYTDYNSSGTIETTFVNNRELKLGASKWQPIRFIVPEPPEIYLYYKGEKQIGERYLLSGVPDEFLLHDMYLGAYAVHVDQHTVREPMMERLLRLRYQDLYYQLRYNLHLPQEERKEEAESYQELMENLTYLSLPDLSSEKSAERYQFVGWKLTELGEGETLHGPCASEKIGLPQFKSDESPMRAYMESLNKTESTLYSAALSDGVRAIASAETLAERQCEVAEEQDLRQASSSQLERQSVSGNDRSDQDCAADYDTACLQDTQASADRATRSSLRKEDSDGSLEKN